MQESIKQIIAWQAAGLEVAVATVTRVVGSAPRPVGARLLVTSDGAFAGSVSGGCVEGAVIEEASQVLADGRPRKLHFGISDEMSWEVGLACGGAIDVLIQKAEPRIWRHLADLYSDGQDCALLTVIGEGGDLGRQAVIRADENGDSWMKPEAIQAARRALQGHGSGVEVLADTHLIELIAALPHLIIFGGVHAAIPLIQMARTMNFRCSVADPRARFANRERFPEADRLLVAWPEEALAQLGADGRSAIVVLTHDPKIDEPALRAALASDAFYIGAIGSRKTHAERLERMRQAGVPDEQLARIHGPIGLDLGGRTPEEMALSILAEIVAVRHGHSGGFLR
jgi:xanthine dehydrogenase accessory factor